MSGIKIKQISPSGASTGGFIIHNGDRPVWSNENTKGLLLPSGNTADRGAAVNGSLRYNAETQKLEYFAADVWQTPLTSNSSLLELADTPNTLTGQGKRVMRVKEDETGFEFFPFASAIRRYRFKVNFDSNGRPVTFEGVEPGWTIQTVTLDDLQIDHQLAAPPLLFVVFGQDNVTATKYNMKMFTATGMNMSYNTTTPNRCLIQNVTASNSGSGPGKHAYVDLYFSVDF